MNWLPEAIRDGILVVLVISGPLVMAAALIGLTIGILQAATQVQEQTIGSALKIIGVFTLMIVLGFWMYQYLSNYTTKTLTSAFTFVPKQNKKVVPSYAFNERRGERQVPQQIPIIKPEKLEATTPPTPMKPALPPGAPALGRPEIPKPPEVKDILPPQPTIPKTIPQIQPAVPLSNTEEPKPIPEVPKNQEDSIDGTLINNNLWQKKELFSYLLNEKDPILLNNSWIESK